MNKLKIIEEKENLLFNRKEIKGITESEITPSRAETLEVLSKKFKVPIENIKIKKIVGKFGSKTFNVEANIYSSEQDKEDIELKKKKEKNLEKKSLEEKQPEEKPTESRPEPETPKQQVTEQSEPAQETQPENPGPQEEKKE